MKLTEAAFLAIAQQKYAQMQSELQETEIDFYEYEKRLDLIMTDFGRLILENGLRGKGGCKRKKKKLKRVLGQYR